MGGRYGRYGACQPPSGARPIQDPALRDPEPAGATFASAVRAPEKVTVLLISDHCTDIMPALESAGIQQCNIRSYHRVVSSSVPMESDPDIWRPDYLIVLVPEGARDPKSVGVRRRDLAGTCRRF